VPCIYILASKPNGTLYVGVTSDILRRVWVHKSEAVDGFTKTYGIHLLVYVEFFGTMPDAILREKQIKNGRGRGRSN
jgi:putative endonuclease